MKNVLLTTRMRRAATLISITTVSVIVVAGAATGAYSGKTSSGEILACFQRSNGDLRIVDHLPCKNGETVVRWNSRGAAGADGKNGRDGADGKAGADGQRGADGARGADGSQGPAGTSGSSSSAQPGAAGSDGKDGSAGSPGAAGPAGEAGTKGETGPQGTAGADGQPGPAGADGARGSDGAPGAQGPTGPQGPAGSAAGAMQFGQSTNHSDPDCAMVGPVGRTAAAACSFSNVQQVGEYLPSNATISGFRILLDRKVNAPVDVIARIIDPTTEASVQAFAVCTVPAGSNTCAQTGERTLTGPNLFAFQMSGDRTWATARFGYTLVQA